MSIYIHHRVHNHINSLLSELPWYWWFWNRRFYLQEIAMKAATAEIELYEAEYRQLNIEKVEE